MMQRIFRASTTIASGAFVLGLAGLFSRLLGVYRDRLLATTFGAGSALDAYYAAFRVPDFIFNLLVLGALSAGFIPIFSEYFLKDKDRAWKLAQSVLLLLAGSLTVTSAFLWFFAPQLISLITPGFEGEVLEKTISLTRIMLLSPVLLGISAVFGGVLQTFKRFLAYSLAPILYNLGIIFGIFVFVQYWGLEGLAWGVVLGSGLHLFMQIAVAMKVGWKFSFNHWLQKKGIKEIVVLMIPRTFSLILIQLNLLVITIFASELTSGSLSIFSFAQNLAHVPIGLFGISFAVSAFPVLSEYANKQKMVDFTNTIYRTTSQILFFLLPSLVIFALLDEQIVRLVYGAGEFTWEATLLTSRTLLYFIPGILAQSLMPLMARSFYAQKDTRHPLYAAIIGLILTVIFSYWLSPLYGVIGLSAAFSLSSFAQILILVGMLRLRKSEKAHSLFCTLRETAVASAFMLVAIQFTKEFTGPYLDLLTVKGVFLHFILPVTVGGITYLIVLKLLKSEEYQSFEYIIKRRLLHLQHTAIPIVGSGEEDSTTI